MAQLTLELEQNTSRGEILGERFEFPAHGANTYCLVQFLRGFKTPSGRQGLFSQEQIARAIPDFAGTTRQSVADQERRFRERRMGQLRLKPSSRTPHGCRCIAYSMIRLPV